MAGFNPTPITPNLSLEGRTQFTCDQCGSVVYGYQRQLHSDWHERLRMAVDEVGTLG